MSAQVSEAQTLVLPVNPFRLEAKDRFWLRKAARALEDGTEPQHLIHLAGKGLVQLWRVRGNADGLLVTRVDVSPKKKDLCLFSMAGVRIVREGPAILSALKGIARMLQCEKIVGRTKQARLAQLYLELGCEETYRTFEVET